MQSLTRLRFILLLLALQSVTSHYAIMSPPPRVGTNDLTETVGPCGGLPIGDRAEFPIKGGIIKGGLYHPFGKANVTIVLSATDPTPDQFGQVFLLPENTPLVEGNFNLTTDLSTIPGVKDRAKATIQVVVLTVDG
ncbi:hypothetical protein HDU99_009228, partial [Rhizoclosmatium hyalinum]